MRKLFFVLVLLSQVAALPAEECDCTIYPFSPDPPCFDECVASLLAIASEEDLLEFLKLDKDVAERIKELDEDKIPRALAGYKEILSRREFGELERKLRNLEPEEFNQLREEARRRGKRIEDVWKNRQPAPQPDMKPVPEEPRERLKPPPERNPPGGLHAQPDGAAEHC